MWLFFVIQYNSLLSSFAPNFRILSQMVAEKTFDRKNANMYYERVTEGKNEKMKNRRQNED